ncbi:MAG: malto-oligosyltrehalose trehalohydrolase [Bacteroidales bacterium]
MTYKKIYPEFNEDQKCIFRVWAPGADRVELVLSSPDRIESMDQNTSGYWEKSVENLQTGTRYTYRIDGGGTFPDPASLSQPEGVHGPSELIRLDNFKWSDDAWVSPPLSGLVLYELHTGTFSGNGEFGGIIEKLDYLIELGINAIEIMPVVQFSGERNWGYDGVYPFAVQNSYGGAEGLMRLVDACHQKGIAVILDVVYNHLGPEGNYLSKYGPYFSDNYSTPWGKPVNFDGPHSDAVRNYFIQNAMMWCRDFHIDGLRLDAVHAIYDFSAKHFLRELKEKLDDLGQDTGRSHYLIAESNLNDIRLIEPLDKGGYGLDAQWSDDFHHALHVLATGETGGYYVDFDSTSTLSKALKQSFVFDGTYSAFRKKSYGNSAEPCRGEQFVVFSQNHDQVGNRKKGERLISLTGFEMAKLITGAMFLAPNIPMLFMGEEYGETNPFLYFVSHEDDRLNRLVREGRKNEFREFYTDDAPVPDPASKETFEKSLLSWAYREGKGAAMLAYYKRWIQLRRSHPVLSVPDKEQLTVHEMDRLFFLERWQAKDRIIAYLNFHPDPREGNIPMGIKGALVRLINSASEKYMGPGEYSPETVTANDQFAVPGKSLVVYAHQSS